MLYCDVEMKERTVDGVAMLIHRDLKDRLKNWQYLSFKIILRDLNAKIDNQVLEMVQHYYNSVWSIKK